MTRLLIVAIILLVGVCPAQAGKKRLHPERWYQERWCAEHNGRMEVRLPDRTRVDCIAEGYAIEFDFANKWKESIGQALHYAHVSCLPDSGMECLKPGIVLIMESPGDQRYMEQLQVTVDTDCLEIRIF